MDAAGAVDAQNAPTAPWKTAQNAVSHSAHPHPRFQEQEEQNEQLSTSSTHEIPDTPIHASLHRSYSPIAIIWPVESAERLGATLGSESHQSRFALQSPAAGPGYDWRPLQRPISPLDPECAVPMTGGSACPRPMRHLPSIAPHCLQEFIGKWNVMHLNVVNQALRPHPRSICDASCALDRRTAKPAI